MIMTKRVDKSKK